MSLKPLGKIKPSSNIILEINNSSGKSSQKKEGKKKSYVTDDEEDTLEEDIDNFSVCQERMI
jgi:hypothetical protein